jgi:predicted acyl esterase
MTAEAAGPPSAGPAIDQARRVQSVYVRLSDGVRLAVDVWLPVQLLAAGAKVGAILRATRYQRAGQPAGPAPESDTNFGAASVWNEAGFALVLADARGTGASFGSRATELSVREIADYGELIDWIAAQPWSNGRVGAYGYSYDGDAAELMIRLGNPHLAAVAALFSDFDPYRQLVYPGGAYTEGALGKWLGANRAYDGIAGALEELAASTGLPPDVLASQFRGVKPAGGPDGTVLLGRAIAEHQANADLGKLLPRMPFRDDRQDGVDWDTLAVPHWQEPIEAAGVPILVRVGWLDAGTAAGALTRFATFSGPQEVEIGPWGHGGHTLADPLRPGTALGTGELGAESDTSELSEDSQLRRLLDFFARYVQRGEKYRGQHILRYSTLGTGDWQLTTCWPPDGLGMRRWFLAPGGRLAETVSPAATIRYAANPAASSGEANRWTGNVLGQAVAYPDRLAADELLLTHTSDPLDADLHVLGFPVVTLRLATSGTDGAVYVYLEDVGPDSHVAYVTEGQLRLVHRKTAGPPEPAGLGVPRTFARADSQPVRPGQHLDLTVELFPVSALIRAGHRLRIAVAGHDAACFARYGPASETFTLELGPACHLVVPVAEGPNM